MYVSEPAPHTSTDLVSFPHWQLWFSHLVLGRAGVRGLGSIPPILVVVTTFEILIALRREAKWRNIWSVHKGQLSTRHAYALDTTDLET
jgi:hypothetical protein